MVSTFLRQSHMHSSTQGSCRRCPCPGGDRSPLSWTTISAWDTWPGPPFSGGFSLTLWAGKSFISLHWTVVMMDTSLSSWGEVLSKMSTQLLSNRLFKSPRHKAGFGSGAGGLTHSSVGRTSLASSFCHLESRHEQLAGVLPQSSDAGSMEDVETRCKNAGSPGGCDDCSSVTVEPLSTLFYASPTFRQTVQSYAIKVQALSFLRYSKLHQGD